LLLIAPPATVGAGDRDDDQAGAFVVAQGELTLLLAVKPM
jgi:hypothetical protein